MSSIYYEVCPTLTQGSEVSPVVRQVFPVPEAGAEGELVGDPAAAIIRDPNRISLMLVRDRIKTDPSHAIGYEYVLFNRRLEVQLASEGQVWEIDGWEVKDDGERLVGEVERALGFTGLTIVLERGILERPR